MTWGKTFHGSTSKGEITVLVDNKADVDDPLADIAHVRPERQVLGDIFRSGTCGAHHSRIHDEYRKQGIGGGLQGACHGIDRPARDRFVRTQFTHRMLISIPCLGKIRAPSRSNFTLGVDDYFIFFR